MEDNLPLPTSTELKKNLKKSKKEIMDIPIEESSSSDESNQEEIPIKEKEEEIQEQQQKEEEEIEEVPIQEEETPIEEPKIEEEKEIKEIEEEKPKEEEEIKEEEKKEEEKPKEEPKKMDYRDRVVNEILDTEVSYVKSMEICVKQFYEPMTKSTLFSPDDVKIIFAEFSSVLGFNSILANKMQELQEEGTLSLNVGEAFKTFLPCLSVYKRFLVNSEVSLKALDDLEKQQKIMDYLEELRTLIPGENQLDLRSFLIMPVQRLPRYKLLLTDLIKHTDDSHQDKQKLQDALQKISDLAIAANNEIKERAQREKVFSLVDKIEGMKEELAQPSRRYIKDGVLYKVCRKENKPRYFYLFNDVLIYGEGDENKMKVSQQLPLLNMTIRDHTSIPKSFTINSKKSFVVIAETEEEKKKWMETLAEGIKIVNEGAQSLKKAPSNDDYVAPVWNQDTPNCELCDAKFTTLFRKHHCRKC